MSRCSPQFAFECNHDMAFAEFGFGTRRAESEALVASLQPSYSFQQLRLHGDYVRVLRAYPGKWQVRRSSYVTASPSCFPVYMYSSLILSLQYFPTIQVHVMDRNGSSDLIAVQLERPTYQQVSVSPMLMR
jgi:hypothetical protein